MIAEIFLADKKPVLKNVVLRTGGITATPPLPPVIPVNPDPSPMKRPYTIPAEIVENQPYVVDIEAAVIRIVLSEPAIISPIFINPLSLPIVRLSTVSDDT